MTTQRRFRCTSCGTSQRRLSNLSYGELKWKTKQGERSNALDKIMIQNTQTRDL